MLAYAYLFIHTLKKSSNCLEINVLHKSFPWIKHRFCYPSLPISAFPWLQTAQRITEIQPPSPFILRAVFHIVCPNKSWNTAKFDLPAERGRLLIWFHSAHMLCRNALRGALVSSMRRCGHVFRSWQRGAAVLFCSESKSSFTNCTLDGCNEPCQLALTLKFLAEQTLMRTG